MDTLSTTTVAVSFAAIFAVSKAFSYASSYLKANQRRDELSKKAAAKRNQRDALRRKFEQMIQAYLESREEKLESTLRTEIAYMTAEQLRNKIQEKKLNIADVVAVFSSRAIQSGKALDIVAEERYNIALEEAQKLDQLHNTDSAEINPDGILFGIPISVKDHIDLEGMDSTCGLAARCCLPSSEDAVVIQLLRKAGAIPIVRGNVPQCIMLPESDNLVWGRSKNPWNVEKTPGGSSGGDAALVSTRSVPIAIGSDIGGSIRIPAHSCGVFGLKPTPGRISYKGCTIARPEKNDGQQIIHCTTGPIANCVEDLSLVMRAWLVPEMSVLDPAIPYTGFDMNMFQGFSSVPSLSNPSSTYSKKSEKVKLKIGYFDYDGYVDYAPTAKRAVGLAVDALRRLGHEVVPFSPPDVAKAALLYLCIMGADGGMRGFFEGLDGETLHPMYYDVKQIAVLPDFLRPLVSSLLSFIGEKRASTLITGVAQKSAYEHWKDVSNLHAYIDEFTEKWTGMNLDAVICPGLHLPAFNHDTSGKALPLFASCFLWNVVHYPVGSIPITRVQHGEDDYISNAKSKDRFSHFAHEAMQGSEGLPFGVQVAALPFRDELVLRIMQELQDELKTGAGQTNEFVPPFAQTLDSSSTETHM